MVYVVIVKLKRNKGGKGDLLWFCWWAMTPIVEKQGGSKKRRRRRGGT
jgi:hypothetical protein